MSNTTWNPIVSLDRRQRAFKLTAKKESIHPFKKLSTRYLNDAKKLGYIWNDLLNKKTREKVIDKVVKSRMTKAIKKAQRDSFKQTIADIKQERKMEKVRKFYTKQLIKKQQQVQQKQTADVLIFQRFENEEDIPRDRKIAFRDHLGKPYIMRFRRYLIIDRISRRHANRFIGKRIYDYNDNDFNRVVKFLDTSEDFKMFNTDYINCIIIDSLTDIDNKAESVDLLNEDLFTSREEHGVFSRYININQDKRVRNMEDNSSFVKLIIKRFQKAFEKASLQYKKYRFDLTTETLCDLRGIEYKNENIGLPLINH